jgi:hypothetical protein
MSKRRHHHDHRRNGGVPYDASTGLYPKVSPGAGSASVGFGADGALVAPSTTPGISPIPDAAPPSAQGPNPSSAILTQAAHASQGDHPAVTATLVNAAAQAQGQAPPKPPPVGAQDAAVLNQAAQQSKAQGDHPVVTAALASGAQSASANGAKVAQVLTKASQESASAGDHPAITAVLTNGAAKAMGAPPVAPQPKGPDAALALSTAAHVSAAKKDHPIVTAVLADAAVKASSPTVAAVLAQAAAGPDMSMHPAAADALAKAAVANAPPRPGAPPPAYANLPGAPNAPPIPKAPPAMPAAAYPEGAPPSPPAAPPPPPPALAAVPAAQATAIEASTLSALAPKDGVDLQPGETLDAGGYIAGHRRGRHGGPRHKLVMQNDGNLVLYDHMTPIWASHTGGTGARRAHMRTDGNFVLEDGGGNVVWASGGRSPGSFVVLQDDGNFVQYCGNRALWASHQDGRSRGRDIRRVGNVFLGGARHFGRRGGAGAGFGAESVRDERVFRKLSSHMRNAIDPQYRRGLDLALETSTGLYSDEEVAFALAQLNQDDRAGFAAGTALKIGLAHPAFGEHVRSHFHGDLGPDGFGDDMGGEWWKFWTWFSKKSDADADANQPPTTLALSGPTAAPAPAPDDGSGGGGGGAAAAAPAPAEPQPSPPSDPAQPDDDGTNISDPLTMSDGTVIAIPVGGFRDWASRRRWELDQRGRWQRRFGVPVTGHPNWNDPLVFTDGTMVPLPAGGFHDWASRRAWEAQQRGVWRDHGGHHPDAQPLPPPSAIRRVIMQNGQAVLPPTHRELRDAVVAQTGMTPHQINAQTNAMAALAASIGLPPPAPQVALQGIIASTKANLTVPFVLPDGSSYPLPPRGFHDMNERHAWETARLGEFHAGRIHGVPQGDPRHPFHATIAPQTNPPNYVTPVTNPSTNQQVPPHAFTLKGGRTPNQVSPPAYVADLNTGALVPTPAAPTAIRNVVVGQSPQGPQPPTAIRPVPPAPTPPPHIISIPKQVVQTGGTTTLNDPNTGAVTHVIDPSTGVAHPATPAQNTVTGAPASHPQAPPAPPATGTAHAGSGGHGGGSGHHGECDSDFVDDSPAAISSAGGTPIVNAPVSPVAAPPPPGVPATPMSAARAPEETHPFLPEHAHTAPPDMTAPHEDAAPGSEYSMSEHLQMEAFGSEYSMSEHLQMEANHDPLAPKGEFLGGFGVEGNFQFGGNVAGVEGNFQFGGNVAGVEGNFQFGLEQAAIDSLEDAGFNQQARAFRGQTGFGLEPAAIASLEDGGLNQGYRAFPNQTGFGREFRRDVRGGWDRRAFTASPLGYPQGYMSPADVPVPVPMDGGYVDGGYVVVEEGGGLPPGVLPPPIPLGGSGVGLVRDQWGRPQSIAGSEMGWEFPWRRHPGHPGQPPQWHPGYPPVAGHRHHRREVAGFGWEFPWRRRRHPGLPGQPPYGQPGYPPNALAMRERERLRRRDRRIDAGADPVTNATNAAALQAAGAAAAIGSTVLGHDGQKSALSVLMTHPHLRLGALSTGLGNIVHKLMGIFDFILHPTLKKSTIAPDGKGGLITTLPEITIKGKAG